MRNSDAFIAARFATGRRRLPREEFDAILDFAARTPGDVQEYCDAIWQVTESRQLISPEVREQALQRIFAREGAAFSAFARRLTDGEYKFISPFFRDWIRRSRR